MHDVERGLEVPTGDVHHRHLEARVWELGIERERSIERPEPRLAPQGMAETILMPPAVGLERDGLLGRAAGLVELQIAGEEKRQRGVRFGESGIQIDRVPRVIDPGSQGPDIRRARCAAHLVGDELGVRESAVGNRVLRIDRHGRLEVADRRRIQIQVHALELEPALHVGAVGLEARRFAEAHPRAVRRHREPQIAGEAPADRVLQGEDVFDRTIDFGVGQDVAAVEIDESRGNAEIRAAALETSRDHELRAHGRADLVHAAATCAPHGFENAPAIDDAKAIERREVARDGFRDARAEPGGFGIGRTDSRSP